MMYRSGETMGAVSINSLIIVGLYTPDALFYENILCQKHVYMFSKLLTGQEVFCHKI